MVAIREHAPFAPDEAIETARQANRQPCDPAAEPLPVPGLDDQVNMGVLNREMHDPKLCFVFAVRCAERGLHLAQFLLRPKLPDLGS